MTDILSAIGLTSGTPDPTDFLKQKEVTDQVGQVRADATSTLGSISFALDTAETIGISSTSLSSLRALQDRAKRLTDATNLTPAQMEAERTRIEQDLAKVKAEQEELARQAELQAVKDVAAAIASEKKLIDGDTTLPEVLKASIKALEEKVKVSLTAVQKAVSAKKEIPSTVQTAAELKASLESLQAERETTENTTSSGGARAFRTGIRWAALAIMVFTLIGSAILGGIVLANTFIEEVFWGIRLYYFIYGAIGFPLSLLYGVIRPPIWQSTILPWTLEQEPNGTGSSLFSYRLFTPEDIAQQGEQIEGSRSMLRWMSLGGLIAPVLSVLAYRRVA